MPGILAELRVLELTHRPSGAYCAKLLADQGADTIKVEPPGWGDQARHEPPFIDEVPDPDRGTSFLAFNTNKRGITLDVEQAAGRGAFRAIGRHCGYYSGEPSHRGGWRNWDWAMNGCPNPTPA